MKWRLKMDGENINENGEMKMANMVINDNG